MKIIRSALPTIKYSKLQGCFWMSFCVIFNYTSVYLLNFGFSNLQIGFLIAIAGILSAVLQPMIAGFAGEKSKMTLRNLIRILSTGMIGGAAILLFPGLHVMLRILLYGILICFLQVLTPLINAIGMEWINRGVPINFGIARGIGSVSYACISFATGALVAKFHTPVIPILIMLCFSFLFLFSSCFQFSLSEQNISGEDITDEESAQFKKEQNIKKVRDFFFRRYPKFGILQLGIILLFSCHNILNNFLFQIMNYHGGTSVHMGIASSFCAFLELPTMLLFSVFIRRFNSGVLLKISGVFFTLKSILTLCAPGIMGIYLAQLPQMLGFALFIPASVYYTNSLLKPEDRVKGQAYMTATNTLGSVVGSMAGGAVIDQYGIPALLLVASIISAIGMLVVFFSTEHCTEEREIPKKLYKNAGNG